MWAEAGAQLGYGFTVDDVRPLIGMGGDRVIAILTNHAEGSTEYERLDDAKGEIFRQRYLPFLKPFPGARDLLVRLKEDGFALVVASSASGDDLATLLRRAHVEDLIEAKTGADDAEASKPAGDIVEAAIRSANVDRTQLVMLGDTPYDVEAARHARVPAIACAAAGGATPSSRARPRSSTTPPICWRTTRRCS